MLQATDSVNKINAEAGKTRSRGAKSLEDSKYIFNDLLKDMKKNRKIDELFNSINEDEKKSFYDIYIQNYQLNNEGIQLANQLENDILVWAEKNINGINNLYSFISILKNNINIFTSINEYEYDSNFKEDFKTFIELACKYLYNQNNSKLKQLIFIHMKPNYKITEEDVKTLAEEIYTWYKNNYDIIYIDYISKGNFNLKQFLKNWWTQNIQKVYDILVINPGQYSSSLKDTIKQMIIKAINKALEQYKFSLKKKNNEYTELEKEVLNSISNQLDKILDYVEFPKEQNGAYTHSWLGKAGTRKDANAVIEYLANNIQFCKQILKIKVDDIKKKTNLTWAIFLRNAYENNYDEDFQLKVRQYLVNKNIRIHDKQGKSIFDKKDDKGDYTYISFSARKDQNRSRPAILVHTINGKDHLLFGEYGANHGSILTNNSYTDIFNNCYSLEDKDREYPHISFVYILGNIAFVNKQEYCGYSSWDKVASILIKDSNIEKVYFLPPERGGKVLRLAQLLKK